MFPASPVNKPEAGRRVQVYTESVGTKRAPDASDGFVGGKYISWRQIQIVILYKKDSKSQKNSQNYRAS